MSQADEITRTLAELTRVLGSKLTGYIRRRDLDLNQDQTLARLRLAFELIQPLTVDDQATVVQAWLLGINPELGDRVPLRLLHEEDLTLVASDIRLAVASFRAGG
jgi:hypothetical protein